ncbi:family 43 glycosylhydrolase [Bacillus sp. JJ1533]|uniref:family 43 glycosylhydrolase n=1 Tax=Bacillus sp. JJ1533 TaxID=3122959 RepID=UPI002FFEAEF3
MKRISILFIIGMVIIMSSCSQQKSEEKTYENPVFEPVIADPSIVKGEDGYFYAFGTEDDWGDEKGARLIPIVRSKNLTDWTYVGEAFQEKPTWKETGSLWAPDISYFNGKYYLYYSMSVWGDANPGIGVAISDNPEGPYQDQGKLFDSKDIGVGNSIDPMLYVDKEGTPYLFWGSFHGIFVVELAKDGFQTVGDPIHIAGNDYEAAYVIKRNDYFYFFGSRGTCCEGDKSGYNVAVGRSKNLTGPYVDKDGKDLIFGGGTLILTGQFPNDEGPKLFAGPGHNSIVTDDQGTDWIVYHAVDKDKPFLANGATRRSLMIDPLQWEDEWPTVEGLVPSNQPKPVPVFNQ